MNISDIRKLVDSVSGIIERDEFDFLKFTIPKSNYKFVIVASTRSGDYLGCIYVTGGDLKRNLEIWEQIPSGNINLETWNNILAAINNLS